MRQLKTQPIIHYKPYSDDVLGYRVSLNNGGFEFVINSNLSKEKQEYAYTRLIVESPHYEKYGFILLHSNDVIYYHDAYNYSHRHKRYLVAHDKSKVINLEQHKQIIQIGNNKIKRQKEVQQN